MKILLLGGPRFLGYHIIESALMCGHEVVLFNRGKSNPDLFPELERVVGDRKLDLKLLEKGKWDAVIDTCGYFPSDVAASTSVLSNLCDHYTFVSTISVYDNFNSQRIDENSPVATIDDANVTEITGETYGPLKALCETAAESEMPGRVLNVRPGLIVGPRDPSDRFTYWVGRALKGGTILAPVNDALRIQLIDSRDLADWIIHMAETKTVGVYNATGPDFEMTMADVLYNCIAVSGVESKLVWADEAWLLSEGIQPFLDLPLWVPKDYSGMMNVDIGKAIGDGLVFRPLKETIRATMEWYLNSHHGDELRAGLTIEKEKELLEKWVRNLQV